jgi:hypothetical protein
MSILFRPFGFIVNLADYVYPVQALKFTIKPKGLNRIDIIG